MARVIVTGGAGFIGSHLVDALVRRRHHVVIIDDLSSGRRANVHPRARLVVADIRSRRMATIWRTVRPNFVFHLAAQKNVRWSVDHPVSDAETNILGSLNVLEQSRRQRIKKFIFSSTGGALYGDHVRLPTSEDTRPSPGSPYGIAKLAIEHYLRFYHQVYGLASISLRYSNVYGPRQDPQGEAGVVAIFAQKLLHGQPLVIHGHGRQTRDYIYVSDVVRANLAAMKQVAITGEINIGTGRQTSVNDLARVMITLARTKTKILHRSAIMGEVMKSGLSWTQAKKLLHWKPKVKLTEGLQQTWAWTEGARA